MLVITRGQVVFKLQPTTGHQNAEEVEGQKEEVRPLSSAPWGAAQGAAEAGSPATPAAPFTKRLTLRAGFGTGPDQMPLGRFVLVMTAGAPHFSQQQFEPMGQGPYACATLGANVMNSQRGWLQQAAWQEARPPDCTWFPRSLPGASLDGPDAEAAGHCSAEKVRATPPTQMPPTYEGKGVRSGMGAPPTPVPSRGMVLRSTQQGAPTAHAAARPACAVGAKVKKEHTTLAQHAAAQAAMPPRSTYATSAVNAGAKSKPSVGGSAGEAGAQEVTGRPSGPPPAALALVAAPDVPAGA